MRSLFSKRFLAIAFILMPLHSQGQIFDYTLEHCKSHGGDHECVDRIEGIGEYIPSMYDLGGCDMMYPHYQAHDNNHNYVIKTYDPANVNGVPAPEGFVSNSLCSPELWEGFKKRFFQSHPPCPDGHSAAFEEPGNSRTAVVACVEREYQCECNETKYLGHCTPMRKKLSISARPDGTYIREYGDNGHEAPTCPWIYIAESNGNSCDADTEPTVGNPINCATAQKIQREVDYSGFGVDPIEFERTYLSEQASSVQSDANPIGTFNKWENTASPLVTTYSDDFNSAVKVFKLRSGVTRVAYRYKSNTWKWNTFFGPFRYSAATDSFTVTLESGDSYRFDSTGSTDNETVTQTIDDLQRYTYEYITLNGVKLISKISNRFNRYLTFSYGDNSTLSKITDQDGVEIHYEYDDHDNLIKVMYPDSTPMDLTDNPTKTYLYENAAFPNHLTGIMNQNGQRYSTYRYDNQGRAISTEHSQGIEKVVVSYPEDGKAIVKHYRNDTRYREEHIQFDMHAGQYRLTSKEITLCDGCLKGIEYWEYDSKGNKTRHIDYDGTITKWTYYPSKKLKFKHEAFGLSGLQKEISQVWDSVHKDKVKIIRTPSTITTYEYDEYGNLISEIQTER